MPQELPVTHLTTYLREEWGGMQAIVEMLKRPIDQIVRLYEAPETGMDGELGLGATGLTTPAQLRRAFRQSQQNASTACIVYHNAYALGLLADLDRAERRLIYIHTVSPLLSQTLPNLTALIDGVIACGPVTLAYARRLLPELPVEAFYLCSTGLTPGKQLAPERADTRNPIRLVYCGRMVKEQKRLDRLPMLIQQLDKRQIPFEFTLVGDGPLLPWLRQRLGGDRHMRFTGRISGDAYWSELAQAHCAVLLSDYEGASIFLDEAMLTGAIPLLPIYDEAVRDLPYVQRHPELAYETGHIAALADSISLLQKMPATDFAAISQFVRELVKTRSLERFQRDFHAAINDVHQRSARAKPALHRRSSPWDFAPLSLVTTLNRRHLNADRF